MIFVLFIAFGDRIAIIGPPFQVLRPFRRGFLRVSGRAQILEEIIRGFLPAAFRPLCSFRPYVSSNPYGASRVISPAPSKSPQKSRQRHRIRRIERPSAEFPACPPAQTHSRRPCQTLSIRNASSVGDAMSSLSTPIAIPIRNFAPSAFFPPLRSVFGLYSSSSHAYRVTQSITRGVYRSPCYHCRQLPTLREGFGAESLRHG
jgi:hypothetical protein